MKKFRDLKASEIEVRVASVAEDRGISLLLYKDARSDMNILDETVGMLNWKREHLRNNANCVVSIWDEDKEEWVGKEDTGTESNTEAQKGLASDSFKRACFNWGIGRELYTAPYIWVSKDKIDIGINKRTNKPVCYDKFFVNKLTIDNGTIVDLEITRKWSKTKPTEEIVYRMNKQDSPSKTKPVIIAEPATKFQIGQIEAKSKQLGLPEDKIEARLATLQSKTEADDAIAILDREIKKKEDSNASSK